MQDLSALIAPRKLVVIAGEQDLLFPIDGVKRGFETVKRIYEKAGCGNNCSLRRQILSAFIWYVDGSNDGNLQSVLQR